MFAELLTTRLAGIVELSPQQIADLETHFNFLVKWSRAMNLTSLRDPEEIVERHYCESLFLGSHLPPGRLKIADIGSGAGFPGFPVAVLRRESSVALIESRQRKSVFLKESTRHVTNVRVISKPAEAVNESFDWAISRAVKPADITDAMSRFATHVAILTTGRSDLKLPWGTKRYLTMFHVERNI